MRIIKGSELLRRGIVVGIYYPKRFPWHRSAAVSLALGYACRATTPTTMGTPSAVLAVAGISYHHDIVQGTDEWLQLRRGIITASEIKTLVTPTGKLANNDTSRKYLHQILAERVYDGSEASFCNDDMMRGHLLEPFARSIYAEHFAPVEQCGFIVRDYGSYRIGYSPDGLVGDDGLIEIKSRLAKHHIASLLAGDVPAEHLPQIQGGLAVSGRAWCDFVSYTPGLPFYRCRVHRDDALIATLEAAAEAAEIELQRLHEAYQQAAAQYPATEQIQPEAEITI